MVNDVSRADEWLAEMRKYAKAHSIPVMLVEAEELLKCEVSKHQPKRVLEIGTAIGYSGVVMLTASESAKLNTIEYDEKSFEIAQMNFEKFGLRDRVHTFLGDAREIVPMLTGEYDFIFMDGPKGQYIDFLPYLMEVLSIGGVLVCDNVLFRGLVKNQPHKRHRKITIARNLKSFIEAISNDERLETKLYEIGDGLSVSVRIK